MYRKQSGTTKLYWINLHKALFSFKDQNFTSLNDTELVDIALNEWYDPVKKYGLHNENNTYTDLRLESFANVRTLSLYELPE